jgi:hypothetical protein
MQQIHPGDIKDKQWRAAAKRQGYKFFTVELKAQSTQTRRIWGVIDLRFAVSVPTRQGVAPDFQFQEAGGQAKFEYDDELFGFYAKILDDKDGFNREFFASCWDDGDYDIADAEVRADVEARAAKRREVKKKELKKEQVELEKKDTKVEGPGEKKPIVETVTAQPEAAMFPCPVCAKPVRVDTGWCPECCKKVTPRK